MFCIMFWYCGFCIILSAICLICGFCITCSIIAPIWSIPGIPPGIPGKPAGAAADCSFNFSLTILNVSGLVGQRATERISFDFMNFYLEVLLVWFVIWFQTKCFFVTVFGFVIKIDFWINETHSGISFGIIWIETDCFFTILEGFFIVCEGSLK